MTSSKQDKWLTLEELASYLKVSKSALYKMVQEGRIPGGRSVASGALIGPRSTDG